MCGRGGVDVQGPDSGTRNCQQRQERAGLRPGHGSGAAQAAAQEGGRQDRGPFVPAPLGQRHSLGRAPPGGAAWRQAVEPACCRLVAGLLWGQQPEAQKPGLPAPFRTACSRRTRRRPGTGGLPGLSRREGASAQSSEICSCPPPPAFPMGGGLRSSDDHGMTTPCPRVAAHLSPLSMPLGTRTPRMADLSIT